MYELSNRTDVSYRCEEHLFTEQDMPTFGQRLAKLRVDNKVGTQGEFAEAFRKWFQPRKRPEDTRKHNYTQQQISNWETGSEPSFDVIVGVAMFFGVSPLYMAGLSDDPTIHAAEKDLTPEEMEVIVQMRANEIFGAAIHGLLDLAHTNRLGSSTPQIGEDQSRIASSSKTSQG